LPSWMKGFSVASDDRMPEPTRSSDNEGIMYTVFLCVYVCACIWTYASGLNED